MEYLYIIQQVLIWIITIFWVYQIGISLCSLVKLKEKPIVNEKKNKFMAYTYASEADILNMALFGKTAAQWRNEKVWQNQKV